MRHAELLEEAERLLRKHGFHLIVNRFSSDSCMDIAAKGPSALVVLKAIEDLAKANRELVEELQAVANWISASPLLLAERMGDEELDDDAVYVKNGVFAVSMGALERTLEGDPPLVEVGPAGCFVYIDGDAIRRRREELGLSAGALARMVGVTRMTIYSYERGRKRTTPGVAYRLTYVLGVPVTVPINPLRPREENRPRQVASGTAHNPPASARGLLKLVADILKELGLFARALARAPFEVMASREEEKLAVNVVECHSYDRARIEFTREFAGLAGLRQLVVKPEGYECPDDVPSLGIEELRSVRDADELVRLATS